jgi:hypothetical protein
LGEGTGAIKEKLFIEEELKSLDLNSLTPLDAMNKLSELKEKIIK